MAFPLLAIPVVGSALSGVVSALVTWIANYVSRTMALRIFMVTVLVGLTSALSVTVWGLASGVGSMLPAGITIPASWIVPGNWNEAFGAYLAIKVAHGIYTHAVGVLAVR